MAKLRLVAIAAVLLLTGTAAIAQNASIQLDGGAFKVIGWKPPVVAPVNGWQSVLMIYAGVGDVPPLLGTYSVEAGILIFRPAFPFASGVRYRAVFQTPGGPRVEKVFDGPPKATTPSARVVRVYPSGDVLPGNELKLYIYFSAPMSRGEADQRIHLLDQTGKVMPDVFLPGQELWDPNNTRLTVIFDPGRIKRGLTSNQKMGPSIVEGKHYTFVIDREWKDARGVPMVETFRKSFIGGAEKRNPPDPKQWRVTAPRAGTLDPLTVDFGEPMDYALLQRMLQVSGTHGNIPGAVTVDHHEAEWRFTPSQSWKSGDYNLVVDTALEDLAGNHIGQAFDVDTFAPITEHITTKTVSLAFGVH